METAVLGETKEIFEVWVLRHSYSWDVIMGGIPTLPDARSFKQSLIAHNGYTEDHILIKRVTWTATAVMVVS
jgi:hypothetical protein